MILPSKHLPSERALLSLGSRILKELPEPMTVSALWERFQKQPPQAEKKPRISYDLFVLSLDLLFMIGAIELEGGRLSRSQP